MPQLVYLCIGINCTSNHMQNHVPGVGQFVGDEVTVVVRVTIEEVVSV